MQTLKKHERLRREKVIDLLFSEGKYFWQSPFKVIWKDQVLEVLFYGTVAALLAIFESNAQSHTATPLTFEPS